MQEVVLEVERLIWKGRALSRLPSGQVAIIDPGVFPGERVQGLVSKRRTDYMEVRWTRIERPSPRRRPHPCQYAGLCGGCRFGSLPSRDQVSLKAELLADELARALGWAKDDLRNQHLLTVTQQKAWRYRYRGQVHVASGSPHLKQLRSKEQIKLDDCLLLARPLAVGLPGLCRSLPDGRYTVAASPADGAVLTEAGPGLVELPFRDYPFSLLVEPAVFFQANWELNQDLIEFVRSRLQPFYRLADLFAGAGNFTLPLASAGCPVLGLEVDARAVRSVRRSLAEAGLSRADIRRGDLKQRGIAGLLRRKNVQAAVLDPPRSGAGKRLAEILDSSGLQRLVWVSCDIVNTGRDVKPLVHSGRWTIREMALFDMFPQTWHMEAVLVLDRL